METVIAKILGFVNGFLSLVQMILMIAGWLLKKVLRTDAHKKVTGEQIQEYQLYMEMVEDLYDILSENATSFFSSVKKLVKDFSPENLASVLEVFKNKAKDLTPYDYAFFAGSFLFEVVIGVLIALFTGGASAIAQSGQKLTKFLNLIAREVISTATMGIIDLLQLLRILITKFVQACGKGWNGFKNFIEKLLKGKTDDIVKTEGKVLDEISELDTSEEIFRKILTGTDGGKRFTRSALRRIALDIEKKYTSIGLRVEIVSKKGKTARIKDWHMRGVLGSCNTRKTPPTMYLRYDATELTI